MKLSYHNQIDLENTALFRQYKEYQANKINVSLFNNTHNNKNYKAFPCTLKYKKMKENPLMMAQITKYNIQPEHLKQMQTYTTECRKANFYPRFFTPTRTEEKFRLKTASLTRRERNDTHNNQVSLLDELFPLTSTLSRPKTPKQFTKAELYFSKNLQNTLRSPRLTTIPQYIATKCKQQK